MGKIGLGLCSFVLSQDALLVSCCRCRGLKQYRCQARKIQKILSSCRRLKRDFRGIFSDSNRPPRRTYPVQSHDIRYRPHPFGAQVESHAHHRRTHSSATADFFRLHSKLDVIVRFFTLLAMLVFDRTIQCSSFIPTHMGNIVVLPFLFMSSELLVSRCRQRST